ncbi:MAG: hypothetical protein IPG08_11640 [Sphingobacteriaceae bacterium]|nr:hypothetical protein [Sphingobacteriaceae bacterium]
MEKSLDIALRQQMNVDDMSNLGDIPLLNTRAFEMIAARKKPSERPASPSISIFDLIFNRYKVISLSFCLIGIIFAINFLMTFNIETGAGKISNLQADTTLTVSSNTYLATLNQPTIVEAPAHTSTALTSIITFKN